MHCAVCSSLSFNLQDAQYFTPNAFSFRDSYYVFLGDTWDVPANDASHIQYVEQASTALKAHCAGNYLNREFLPTPVTASNVPHPGQWHFKPNLST